MADTGDSLAPLLSDAPALLAQIVESCPEGIIGNDRAGNIFLFNASAERIFGYSRHEAIGKINASSFYPPGGAREVMEFLYSDDYGGRGQLVDFETEAVHKTGRKFPIRLSCELLKENGREVGTIGFFTDITARTKLQEESRRSEERFRGIIETAGDAIIGFDEDRRIVVANRAAEQMLGYGKGELDGTDFRQLIPAKYGDQWEQIERYSAVGGPGVPRKYVELSALRKSGAEIPIQVSLSEKRTDGKRTVTAILRDISERKGFEEELRVLSITDTLTQLYNRRHFHSLAQAEIERAARKKIPFSLLLIDVDRFKEYNDTYGHAEGDEVLKGFANLARKTVRTMDSCFRFGGEEFLVLLPDTDTAGALVAAERIRGRTSELGFTPVAGKGNVRVTVSIGVAEYHEGNTVDDMIRFADLAMYAAKNSGRNRVACYKDLVPKPSDFPG